MEGCAMPIEILVPLTIFILGNIVATSLAGLGIERIIQAEKS